MNDIQIFNNAEFGNIRTVMIDGEPWFVGKDIAEALGYERADNAIRKHIDEDDKLMHQISASGQNRQMYIINESGLYSLILSSKLPNAKKFKRWVTSEVLPTLRKTGHYEIKGNSPYETKSTSVGEVVNLVQVVRKSMKERRCSSTDIAYAINDLCEQFGIQMPKTFLTASEKEIGRQEELLTEDDLFEQYTLELMNMGDAYNGDIVVLSKKFNEYCEQKGISARKFRGWLHAKDKIRTTIRSNGKKQFTTTVWVKNVGSVRCVRFIKMK